MPVFRVTGHTFTVCRGTRRTLPLLGFVSVWILTIWLTAMLNDGRDTIRSDNIGVCIPCEERLSDLLRISDAFNDTERQGQNGEQEEHSSLGDIKKILHYLSVWSHLTEGRRKEVIDKLTKILSYVVKEDNVVNDDSDFGNDIGDISEHIPKPTVSDKEVTKFIFI